MSALKGSLSYSRFFVNGEIHDDFHDRFLKAIRRNVFEPLSPEEDTAERSGWCRIGEAFELELEHEDVFFNEFINLGFRTDRWALPGPLLRARVRESEAQLLAQKGRDRLTRAERAELKDMTAKRLRREIPPRTRAVDLSWSLNEGIVRFFSASPSSHAVMTNLFKRTFKLELIPEAPYTLAARLGLSKAQESAWAAAEMTEIEGVV